LLTEGVLLALIGGIVGLIVWIRFLSATLAPNFAVTDMPIAMDARIDRRVLVFTLMALGYWIVVWVDEPRQYVLAGSAFSGCCDRASKTTSRKCQVVGISAILFAESVRTASCQRVR